MKNKKIKKHLEEKLGKIEFELKDSVDHLWDRNSATNKEIAKLKD